MFAAESQVFRLLSQADRALVAVSAMGTFAIVLAHVITAAVVAQTVVSLVLALQRKPAPVHHLAVTIVEGVRHTFFDGGQRLVFAHALCAGHGC
jgi:hypothetical protein